MRGPAPGLGVERLYAVAGPYLPAGEHVGAQPAAVRQAAQHPRAREPLEVRARLAATLAEALDGPDPEASADQAVQRDTPHDEVPPRLGRRKLDAAGGQVF
jgi:hypothetical protein